MCVSLDSLSLSLFSPFRSSPTHVCTLPHTPPIITKSAPPPIAFATSPGHVMPPSLMMCPRKPCAASEHSITCVRVAARDLAACVLALVCVQITARRAQTHTNTCRRLRPCTLCTLRKTRAMVHQSEPGGHGIHVGTCTPQALLRSYRHRQLWVACGRTHARCSAHAQVHALTLGCHT